MIFSITIFSEESAAVLPLARLTANAFLSAVPVINSPESVRNAEPISAPVAFEISFLSKTNPDSSDLTINAFVLSVTKQNMPCDAHVIIALLPSSQSDSPICSKTIPLEDE